MTSLVDDSEGRALLVRLKRGDHDALEALLIRNRDVVARECSNRLRSTHKVELEEAVSNTFVAVSRWWSTFKGDTEGEFRAWLTTISRRETSRVNKSAARNRKREVPLASRHDIGVQIDEVPDPAEPLSGHMRECLAELPARQAATVELKLQKLTGSEIADRLSDDSRTVDVQDVKNWFNRACAKLRVCLGENYPAIYRGLA